MRSFSPPGARPWKGVVGPSPLPGNSVPGTAEPGSAGRRAAPGREGAPCPRARAAGSPWSSRGFGGAWGALPAGPLPARLRSQPPALTISPSLRRPSGPGSPYPMCFLLNARVSCLLYSSHMVAGGQALPGVPLSCLRASSQVSGLPHGLTGLSPRFPRLEPPCPGLRRSVVASTS